MKKYRFYLITALAIFCFFPVASFAGSAEEAVNSVWSAFRTNGSEEESIQVYVREVGERSEKFDKRMESGKYDNKFIRFIRFSPEREDKLAAFFIKPKNCGYVTHILPKDLRIWRIKRGRTREIAVSDQLMNFESTDFVLKDFELLTGARFNDYNYAWSSGDKVMVTPKFPEQASYGKRIFTLSNFSSGERYIAAIEYFDKSGQLLKTQYNEVVLTDDGKWRPNRIRVVNGDFRRQEFERAETVFLVTGRKFNTPDSKAFRTYDPRSLKGNLRRMK